MARYARNTVILAKIEGTYGSDPTPTGAANAILVSNPSIDYNYNNVDRALLRGYFGGSEQLVGTRTVNVAFDVELAGSGDAGLTAPAWGPLLRACGFSETDAGAYFEYVPISATLPSVTIYYYLDGVLHKALGCRGTVEFSLGIGERPLMKFKFMGLDGGVTATANATPTLTAFQKPVVITDTNAGDVNFGCTYSGGVLSSGTAYNSRGLQLSLNAEVNHVPLLGSDVIDLVDRSISGSISVDLAAADVASFKTAVDANTTSTLGFSYGTASGNQIVMHMPVVQRINPRAEDFSGRVLMSYDLRVLPSSGNDELKIAVK
jgi:hypothetical protein